MRGCPECRVTRHESEWLAGTPGDGPCRFCYVDPPSKPGFPDEAHFQQIAEERYNEQVREVRDRARRERQETG